MSPIEQEEAMLCQETFNNLDQSQVRIAAVHLVMNAF
jgi:hypothetical protein